MKKINFNKKQKEVFKKLGIQIIYLFGSQAQGVANKLSDADIGIVFKEPNKIENDKMKPYLKLYNIFSDIFPKIKQIDIVFLQFTPINLQYNAIADGTVLYETKKEKTFDYKEYILKKYLDLKYYYDIKFKIIAESI